MWRAAIIGHAAWNEYACAAAPSMRICCDCDGCAASGKWRTRRLTAYLLEDNMAEKVKKRKYSKGSGKEVESEMRRYKKGKAKSGKGWEGGREEPEAGHRHPRQRRELIGDRQTAHVIAQRIRGPLRTTCAAVSAPISFTLRAGTSSTTSVPPRCLLLRRSHRTSRGHPQSPSWSPQSLVTTKRAPSGTQATLALPCRRMGAP
jgi:Family of unknown function (DUF6496)